jgi:hypothetical protein
VSTSGGMERMQFVDLDFNAGIDIRGYEVLARRPEELTRANFVGSFSGSKRTRRN